jgi:hypothetical protein
VTELVTSVARAQRRGHGGRAVDYAQIERELGERSAAVERAAHQSLAMTQRYSHLSPSALDATIRLLEQRPTQRAVGDSLETEQG